MKKISKLQIINTWVILLVLTIISGIIGNIFSRGDHYYAFFIISVMLIVSVKGKKIIDIFMELSLAPKKWRFLLMSYIIILPIIISFIYLL